MAIHPVRVSTVGAVCAILMVACLVLGAVSMGASGVESLVPETGELGLEWIEDVGAAGGLFFAGAWLIILMAPNRPDRPRWQPRSTPAR